ncbi:nucleotidyltransferase domain-containing protein [Deinococcus sp. LM3]|uniref:nucleotidyltransferase domain-containing protein n=1 Tax=Deinococcus sp. LM3 TaxID=1938608 RepID=UPI001F0A414A|nr:nucleotidyltransferase domain-containing protein [Deinococcus sp. LM3]
MPTDRPTLSEAQARLAATVPAALRRIRETPGLLGVLWCGSAARGEANAHSDLDFHVLVRGDERWRANYVVEGVPVEVFHNPARKVRAMFAAGQGDTITMFAEGRVLLPHPELDALVAEARALHAAGPAPRPLTGQERFRLIEEVMDARALAAAGDPLHVLVACRAAELALEGLFGLRGWWRVKPQRWLPTLQERDPDAAHDLRALLTTPDAGARQAALEALAVRVTGDLTYQEGGSDPVPVP